MGQNEEWDKKTIALALFILFGSGTGIVNTVAPNIRAGAFTEKDGEEIRIDLAFAVETLQRQIDECKANQLVHLEEYKKHVNWGKSAYTTDQKEVVRLKMQVEELYKVLK